MEQKDSYNGPFPVIELEGTSFYVNGFTSELVQVDDRDNRIDTQDMLTFVDHMELWFDSETKSAYEGPHFGEIPDSVRIYWLYPIGVIDPIGLNARLDIIRPGWRKDFPADLPVIHIAGRDFFVDEVRNAFRDTENYWNLIHFADVTKQDGKTGIYIDNRVTRVPFPHEFDIYDPPPVLPEHIVFAIVPDGHELAVILDEQRLRQLPDEPQSERRRVGR